MNKQTKHLKGFTIIEVVLVLAIAALIFLMVFIALPALQANQRDTERKQDASIVSSAVTKFVAGERKPLTNTALNRDQLRTYVEDLSTQWDAGSNSVLLQSAVGTLPSKQQIYVYPAAKCEGSVASRSAAVNASTRDAAVVIRLDNDVNTYCVDAS